MKNLYFNTCYLVWVKIETSTMFSTQEKSYLKNYAIYQDGSGCFGDYFTYRKKKCKLKHVKTG